MSMGLMSVGLRGESGVSMMGLRDECGTER